MKLLDRLAGVIVVVGILLAVIGTHIHRWAPPPMPSASVAPGAQAAGDPQFTSRLMSAPLARSVPVAIDVPAIGVHAGVIKLGLVAGGAMAVPPISQPMLAGWFGLGPAPGQPGTAVVVGHVDAVGAGPAIFYKLGELRPGQRIYITLADGRTAVFGVWASALYPKDRFPTATVYGYTRRPSLRLITCGGDFDPRTGHYLSNIVVFATYLGHV